MEISKGHSANVVGRLELAQKLLPLAQVGPDFLILQEAAEHPVATARLVVSIDGREKATEVYLPNGISGNSLEVCYEVRSGATSPVS